LVSDQFESRFSAQHRKYRYCLYYGEPSPFRNRFAHYLGPFFKLDLLQMQAAAQILIGEHDFRHLSRKDPAVQNTVRKLYSIDVTHHRNREIHIDITGTAFIRGMMRRIAGALMEVGLGHLSMQEFQNLLSPTLSPDTHLPVVLPACGLILIKVTYGRHPKDFRLTKI
jgi:tRNA pseudouridine38-40 synthase